MAISIRKYFEPKVEDSLKILAIKINLVNTTNQDQFVYSTQFNVEELEIYLQVMQGSNATKWAKVMEEKLD